MEIQFMCFECLEKYPKLIQDKVDLSSFPDPRDDSISIELNDAGIFSGKCNNGHEISLIIQNPKFEILFDLCIISLIDGYTRESVSGLIASYERFLEFSSLIFLRKLNPTSELNGLLFEKMKLSERQVGAFSALYVACLNEEPILLNNRASQFRNDVIHNGYIPTKEEVISFGNKILEVILPLMNRLKKEYTKEIREYTMESIMSKSKQITPGKQNTTMCMATCLGLFNSDDNTKNISEMILQMDKMKGITFSKYYESERKENRYKIFDAMFGKYI